MAQKTWEKQTDVLIGGFRRGAEGTAAPLFFYHKHYDFALKIVL